MKTNPNEPAAPIKDIGITITDGGRDFYISGDLSKSDFKTNFGGFTKRELIAKDFMAALIASGTKNGTTAMILSKTAISLADTFIKALNEKES